MSLQAKFFACVAPVLLVTAVSLPVVWHFQLQNQPVTPQLVAFTILLTTGGLIFTALLTVYFATSRLVCRPMRRMAREMNRIFQGAEILEPLCESSRSDELGMAARAFNQVLDTVQWTTRALQEANTDLEKRVLQRTAELASRNDQLTLAEQKYRSIFENASDGIFQTTPNGRCLSANPAMVRMLGYDSETEVIATITDMASQVYVDPEVREIFIDRIMNEGMVEQFEAEFVRKNTSRFWASMTTRLVRDEQGNPICLEGLVRDITERKHADWLDQDRRELLEMIARNEPLAQTLQSICRAAQTQCPGTRGMVLMYEESRRQVGAAPTLSPGFVLAMDEMLNLGDHASNDSCFPPVAGYVPDLASDARWSKIHQAALDEGLLACHTLPIRGGHEKILGEFVLLQTQCILMDQKNLDAMQSLAGLAGLAIEHHQLTNRLEYDAAHDPLTGLPNRAQLDTQLPQWIGAAARHHRSLAVLLIDLDGFKNVNDTLGHTTGDSLLKQVALRLSQVIRGSDMLVRMGGDEFNLIATEISSPEDATAVGHRVIEAFDTSFTIEERELFITASVGIAVYPTDGTDSATLQRAADSAMYAAKSAGRNRAMRFDPRMSAAALDRLELEGQLRRAISNTELFLEYQPQVDAQGSIVGVEALLRWQHPRLGRIPPMRFIQMAEQCGLIVSVGAWVLSEACRQMRAWQDSGCEPVRVAVNVSALQFQQSDFLEVVALALNDTRLDPSYLELELTESLLLANTADAVEKVAAIRNLGVAVSIDDFGTGYSSLAYLRRLPVDRLKIDQSFVKELGDADRINTDGGRTAILNAIASLATSLGKRVVAEGVETTAQRDFLIGIGCDTLQGYLFSPPVGAQQIEAMLRDSGGLSLPVCVAA